MFSSGQSACKPHKLPGRSRSSSRTATELTGLHCTVSGRIRRTEWLYQLRIFAYASVEDHHYTPHRGSAICLEPPCLPSLQMVQMQIRCFVQSDRERKAKKMEKAVNKFHNNGCQFGSPLAS